MKDNARHIIWQSETCSHKPKKTHNDKNMNHQIKFKVSPCWWHSLYLAPNRLPETRFMRSVQLSSPNWSRQDSFKWNTIHQAPRSAAGVARGASPELPDLTLCCALLWRKQLPRRAPEEANKKSIMFAAPRFSAAARDAKGDKCQQKWAAAHNELLGR